MKRHAIFVDAGYLFAQGSVSLLGKNTPRSQLKLDEAECIKQLKALALAQSAGIQLLRVYWYDGAWNGPTIDHLAIAEMPDVKLRLGSINSVGEQKEVDSLLVTDLIDLARNQSICDATVVTADTDMRIAVQVAQTFGVRVHLVGLEPSGASQSRSLRQEADTVHEIPKSGVAKFLQVAASPAPKVTIQATAATGSSVSNIIEEAVQRTLGSPNPQDLARLKTNRKM